MLKQELQSAIEKNMRHQIEKEGADYAFTADKKRGIFMAAFLMRPLFGQNYLEIATFPNESNMSRWIAERKAMATLQKLLG